MLAILEYKAGNQTSVRRALEHLGIPCRITADPAELEQAQGIIFPGVGAAGQAMEALTSAGLDSVLRRAVAEGQPLLGICLGCQILLEHSEENDVRTLGIVPGRCVRFPDHMKEEDGSPAPVPHMGWNSLDVVRPGRLLHGIEPGLREGVLLGLRPRRPVGRAVPSGKERPSRPDRAAQFLRLLRRGAPCLANESSPAWTCAPAA